MKLLDSNLDVFVSDVEASGLGNDLLALGHRGVGSLSNRGGGGPLLRAGLFVYHLLSVCQLPDHAFLIEWVPFKDDIMHVLREKQVKAMASRYSIHIYLSVTFWDYLTS